MLMLIRLGLLVGLRAHALKALVIIAIALVGLSLFASSFSARQPMTVGLDVGISSLRLILLLMTLMWSQILLANEIERKTLYFTLSYPYSRTQYLLARFSSIALLSIFGTFLLGALLWGALTLTNWSYDAELRPKLDERLILLFLGIALDLTVVLAFNFLLCTLSTTPFLPFLLSLAFAVSARGLGPTFDYLREARLADPDHVRWFGPLLEYAYLWLPDLSRLDWRIGVLHSLPMDSTQIAWSILMAVCYIVLLLALACLVFERRNLT